MFSDKLSFGWVDNPAQYGKIAIAADDGCSKAQLAWACCNLVVLNIVGGTDLLIILAE